MDLMLTMSALPASDLTAATGGETSAAVRARVVCARERQLARDGQLNARLQGRTLRTRARLDAGARRLLDTALTKLSLSARGHDRVLRVARTIADLASEESVLTDHLAEALQFRDE
jgi:magnesium chelatase family protein